MKYTLYTHRSVGIVILLLAVLSISLTSCGKPAGETDKYSFYEQTISAGKPLALGDDRDIYVFCDESTWKSLNPGLQNSLEREVQLVVKEKYFTIQRESIQDIANLSKYKNLLFIGDLESKGAVSRHIAATLPKANKERIKSTGGDLFLTSNRWVKDQIVVYLVGKDTAGLSKVSLLQSNNLYAAFVNRLGERLAYQTYKTKLIPSQFFASYPFSLKVPENYKLFSDDKKGRFLSFMYRITNESRDFPDKYISVYYEDIPYAQLNEDWVKGVRKYIAAKYYEGDEFIPTSLNVERINFGKYPAWKISGAWKNMKLAIGGGFQSFAFYDHQQKRAYLIDNSVYFPAGDKLPILLELQKVSVTFQTK